MSLHSCPDCGCEVATNSTTAGAFSLPPSIVCITCGVEMEVDESVTVNMDEVE